jgi:hypothetical protein
MNDTQISGIRQYSDAAASAVAKYLPNDIGVPLFVIASFAGVMEESVTGLKRGITNGHSLGKTLAVTGLSLAGRTARNILLFGAGYDYNTTPMQESISLSYASALIPEAIRSGNRYLLNQKIEKEIPVSVEENPLRITYVKPKPLEEVV